MTRVEYLVANTLGSQFKKEIEKATSALISQMQAEFRARHEAMLTEQKARVRDALAKSLT